MQVESQFNEKQPTYKYMDKGNGKADIFIYDFLNTISYEDEETTQVMYNYNMIVYEVNTDEVTEEDVANDVDYYRELYYKTESAKNVSEQDKINADLYLSVAKLNESQETSEITLTLGESERYEKLKEYYDLGLYSDSDLTIFVNVGWLKEDEKETIISNE